jgi:eukaryotic-like serine/threonine-protein kinase
VIDLRDDLVSALAGRYDIERELGHGGMAIVYLARDVRHGRHVALKVLRPELATSLGAERFLREINIAARLTHPNILALHDSGNAGGMLYFVMPHVEGESLRERLEREHQLPIEDALSITRQVGLALDYAHEHGVVHRDIKPENILLLGDHVLVADFGLARALHTAGTNRLTESAVAVGTPAYMSPEQAAADPEVDGRTDLYSLACVLFEMVAGVPPFKGATGAALLAQHLTAKPPSICAQRPHCPASVDAAVARALEKTPADRFRTAREFYAALTAAQPALSPPQYTPAAVSGARRNRRLAVAAVLLVGAVAIVAAVAKGWRDHAAAADSAVHETSYLVLPFTATDATARSDTAILARRLADALGEWAGVHVVSAREVADALNGTRRGGPLRLDDALEIARRLRAAHLLWGETTSSGDSATLHVTLYDVATGRETRDVHAITARGERAGSSEFRTIANQLLRARTELPRFSAIGGAGPSLAAWVACDSARMALGSWDLVTAARQLRAALAVDPNHAQASLWLSLVEMWTGRPSSVWRPAAKRAVELSRELDPRDSLVAQAQLALAEARFPDACTYYQSVARTDSTSVIGWFGIGECMSRDSAVIRDPRSVSGYRFRGSIERAVQANLHVVEDGASKPPAFVYQRMTDLLFTAGNVFRRGRLLGGSTQFAAFPELVSDTLAFVPYPLSQIVATERTMGGPRKAAAIEHNRAILRRLYLTWAQGAPASLEAHTALAHLLEASEELTSQGDGSPSALGQVRRARQLAVDSSDAVALQRDELRLLVKAEQWGAAAALVDSIFRGPRTAVGDSILVGAAALTGRIAALATLIGAQDAPFAMVAPNAEVIDPPPALQADVARTFASAAVGACPAALRDFPARIDRRLESYVADPERRRAVREAILRRVLSLSAPCFGAAPLNGVDAGGDQVVLMQQSLAAGDAAAVRQRYVKLKAGRSGNRPGDVSPDYTFLESWLMVSIGDTAEAVAHLDQSLDALPTLGVYFLNYPAQSAGLVRAMALRAEIAAAAGDRAAARRWSGAVATLWASADPELTPYVQRMRALAGH